MTRDEFDQISDKEYLKFHRITPDKRLSSYPDLCALLYLEKHLGSSVNNQDIIAGSEHDIAFIGFDEEKLTKLIPEDAVYLSRCGVHWSSEFEGLCLFT